VPQTSLVTDGKSQDGFEDIFVFQIGTEAQYDAMHRARQLTREFEPATIDEHVNYGHFDPCSLRSAKRFGPAVDDTDVPAETT
jgi:hypothetical protein